MTAYDWNEMCELSEKLEKYYELEDNSHGEAMEALCRLAQHPDYISDELLNAVVRAMRTELKNYTDHARIIITPTTYKCDVAELEWHNENI
jgi:hypothetical protein